MPRFFPVFLILLTSLVTAQADPVMAVVDFKKALAAHPKAKELEAELRATQENAKKVFEAKQKELKDLDAAIQKAAEATKTKEGNTQQNIDMVRDLQVKFREIQQSMFDVQARTRQTIADRQDAVLPDLAKEVRELVTTANGGKYAIVLDLSALSRDGLPQVIEAPGAFDLTDRVIALLPAK
jgi:Skp family chaperone for outer membrane proteins